MLLVGAPACSSSLFRDYPDTALPGVHAFQQGRFGASAKLFQEIREVDDDDAFLSFAETGMAWHVAGYPARAVNTWLQADQIVEGYGDRPTISGRSILESAGSLVFNDKALPYDGEDFEVALLHGFLAWDFLRQGNLDDAMVEVLRGYHVQEVAEQRYATTYGMNRFARFVAAVTQEMDGSLDEAEIDLKVLRKELGAHPAVDYSLQRLARLQSAERKEEWQQGQLIVVYERGRMPQKVAAEQSYSTRRSTGRISIPAFGHPARQADQLLVAVDGQDQGTAVEVENVIGVARTNLNDRLGWILARSIGRAAAKTILIDHASREVEETRGEAMGFLVSAIGSLLQFATERADLRSWITLPQTIGVLRVPVALGEHQVSLVISGGPGNRSRTVNLGMHSFQAGRPVLVTARSMGARLYAQVGSVPVPIEVKP